MKHPIPRALSLVLALLILSSLLLPVRAADTAQDCIRNLINYYRYHKQDAALDIALLTGELSDLDPAQGQAWQQIMDYWRYLNEEMTMIYDCLPDGLPGDDSLCIVVLGYELTSNGGMKDELIGRLETALRSAEKYPNAYIACTGGGTARNNKTATEAGRMADWLLEQGIAPERIIVENKSYSTIQNAQKTCDIFLSEYPGIHSLAIVTSDYHIQRGSLLFQAQSILNGQDIQVVGHAAFTSGKGGTEGVYAQALDLAKLVEVEVEDMKKPKLSTLSYIRAEGPEVCPVDMELSLSVTAYYSTGRSRSVTRYCNFSGFDLSQPGVQTITVRYTEGNLVASTSLEVEFLAPETLPPQTQPTQAETEPIPEPTVPEIPEPPRSVAPFVLLGSLLLLLLVLLLIKRRSR